MLTCVADRPARELAARSTAGLGWNVGGGFVRAGAGLAINTILARLLGPETFGKLALVMVVLSLGNLVAESGLGTGIIQKPLIDELDVRYAFTMQVAAGIGLGLLTALLARPIGAMLGLPEIYPLLRVMACILPIQAFGQTGAALLRRNLDFRRLQELQIVSYLSGYLILGIPLAVHGYGVWSLVFAQLVQVFLYSAGAWMLSGHSILPHWRRTHRRIAGAGFSITAGNVAAWGVSALPTLLIGRFLGTAALGLYSRAFFVVNTPASILAASLQSTTLTLHSRLRNYPRVSNRAFLGILALCQVVTVPVFFTVAAMPRTVIDALFGRPWAAAAPLLAPLAIAMPLECIAALSGPLLIAKGRAGCEFWVQVLTACSTSLAVGLLAAYSTLPATAWGVLFGAYLVRALASTVAIMKVTALSRVRWAGNLAAVVLLGTCVFMLVSRMETWLISIGVSAWPRLLLLSSLAGATSVGIAFGRRNQVMGHDAIRILIGMALPLTLRQRFATK